MIFSFLVFFFSFLLGGERYWSATVSTYQENVFHLLSLLFSVGFWIQLWSISASWSGSFYRFSIIVICYVPKLWREMLTLFLVWHSYTYYTKHHTHAHEPSIKYEFVEGQQMFLNKIGSVLSRVNLGTHTHTYENVPLFGQFCGNVCVE